MNHLSFYFLLSLPLLVVAYWSTPRAYRLPSLTVLSIGMLSYFSWVSVLALSCVALVSLLTLKHGRTRSIFYLAGITICLITFAGYRSIPYLPSQWHALVFIGLAYYILKALHVLFEGYKGRLNDIDSMVLLAYMTFYPTLLIGPIHRIHEFQSDWRRQSFSSENLSLGLERVLWGYAKLVLIAGYLCTTFFERQMTLHIDQNQLQAIEYLKNVQYGLNLYFSFSGASSIAIGIALMMGFKIPENFNWPYLSCNIADFWQRWHMTLTKWCRDYIYAFTSAITRSHQIAILATMLAIGLWHEFSIRYLLWGAYHGIGLVIFYQVKQRLTLPSSNNNSIPFLKPSLNLVSWFITFNFVMIGFGITRADSWQAIELSYKTLFGLAG